ncbi:hypothetical protein WJX73_006991 [Symbiochloris irregularis]|uniref:Uncharacterized protein n=1 Tax=Symbiochloris irregularis TaxID=706552 RepID=A0AAW1PHW8_9CHLO
MHSKRAQSPGKQGCASAIASGSVQLDDMAMGYLQRVDCNSALRVLKILQEQNPEKLKNPSAYIVALLKKAQSDLLSTRWPGQSSSRDIHLGAFSKPYKPVLQHTRSDVNTVPVTDMPPRSHSSPEVLANKAQVPVAQEEAIPSKPVVRKSYKDLPVISKTVSGRFDLSRDKQHVKLMETFNTSLMAHDCTVEVMGCSQERLAEFVQRQVLELPAEDVPEGCTRPYGQVLLLLVSETDGSLHGPWAAMPSTNSPDQAAVQQVTFRRTAIYIRLPQAATFCILDYEETGWYLPQSLKLKGKKAFIKALTASKG